MSQGLKTPTFGCANKDNKVNAVLHLQGYNSSIDWAEI